MPFQDDDSHDESLYSRKMEDIKNNMSQCINPEEYYMQEVVEIDEVELLKDRLELHSSLTHEGNDFEFILTSGILYKNMLRIALESSSSPVRVISYIICKISPSATIDVFSSLSHIDHCKILYDCPELLRIFMLTTIEPSSSLISKNILLISRYVRKVDSDICLALHILEKLALKRCITIEDMVYITSIIEDVDGDYYCSILNLLTTDYGLVSRCDARELKKIVRPLCRTRLDLDYLS